MYRQDDEGNGVEGMNILVGLSGGVDSSTAALLLKEQGHNVIGATMAIYRPGKCNSSGCGTSHKGGACYGPDEKEDIEEARRIAKQLDIPYYVFDCVDEYEEIVLEYFKSEYLKGKTPNPCIRCNSLVKFGVLPALARKHGIEFDKFATGHYARVNEDKNGKYVLKKGRDNKKDQSYFLYRLTKEQLQNIILPLGDYSKDEIREIAKKGGLQVAEKPDSQDFYEGDYNELLGVQAKAGNIVDMEGNVLGTHDGIWNYTIGQRKGLGVSSTEALYVIELRSATNEVVVGFKDKTFSDRLIASDFNWIALDKLEKEIVCQAKIRSTQNPTGVTVRPMGDGKVEVIFDDMQKSIAPGQSVVLYDGDIVLGGGIIQ